MGIYNYDWQQENRNLVIEALKIWATTDGYIDIRSGQDPKNQQIIDDWIDHSNPYLKKLYRGITVNEFEINKLDVNDVISMKGISSWTNRIGIAQDFINKNLSPEYPIGLLFSLPSGCQNSTKLPSKQATHGILRFDEGEVLISSKQKFKILNINYKSYQPKIICELTCI